MDSNAEAEKITWVKADNFKNIAGGAAREAFAAVAGRTHVQAEPQSL